MPRTALFFKNQTGGLSTVEDMSQSSGNRYYVCSVTGTNGAAYGQTPDAPLATIDYAIGLCTASKGDIIYAMPGHVETISGDGTITADIAGISIIGLGNGSNRPKLTWSATASTFLVTAANVTIKNILCLVSIDSVVIGFDVSAAYCVFDKVDFAETSAKQMLIFINTAATATDMTIRNCTHVQAAAGSAKWIDLVGADRAIIEDNRFHVSASTHVIGGTTTASLQLNIHRNQIVNPADAAAIVLLSSSTGLATYNNCVGGKTAVAGTIALASAYGVQNLAANTANKSGFLDPVVDT